ncbi:MAG: thiamine-phosphate kinase [Herminiimonas sp.]|nr:thiamine-phosphate kinase [Herminiimonas sp.]
MSEFDLIRQYFTRPPDANARIGLGIGDDCALLRAAAGCDLAISTDMLVEGRHFFAGAEPEALGHKCLAINLSDLAAMGAAPVAFTLALALPAAEPDWLAAFSRGLLALADASGCALIGGDTTRGPLTISITVFGDVPPTLALRRDAARPGDEIWVSGTLGDARLALGACLNETTLDAGQFNDASTRLHRPTPRLALGMALRGIARAAIDISDGFAGDLEHILERSGCGASVDVDALPLGPVLRSQARALQRSCTLAGGDDYELCFTAAPDRHDAVLAAAHASATPVACVGIIDALPGLRLHDATRQPYFLTQHSFDHFKTP